jgi:hypothetical protein
MAPTWLGESAAESLRAVKSTLVYVFPAYALGALAYLFHTQKLHTWGLSSFLVWFCLSLAGLVGLFALYAVVAWYADVVQRSEWERRKPLREAIEAIPANPSDLKALLKANAKQLNAYDALARNQAKTAYRYGQLATAAGLIMLLIGVFAAISHGGTTTKVTAGVLTGIGGALSGYISKTYLTIYKETLAQLNRYFEQPLVASYVLTAERLAATLPDDSRPDEYKAIIQEYISARFPVSAAVGSGGANGDAGT